MIRSYSPEDYDSLFELLHLLTPRYFDPEEEKDLADFLEHDLEHYFVYEKDGRIIGAGGYNTGFENGRTVRLSWDMVHPDFHGKGVGSKLTKYRINQIKNLPEVDKIVVRTTQLVYKFYQKQGFKIDKTEKNYWANGFDLYQMHMKVAEGSLLKNLLFTNF